MTGAMGEVGLHPNQNSNNSGETPNFVRTRQSHSFARSWLRKNKHNNVSVLVPVCLTFCFLIMMLGAIFLFTSFFLISKFYVINTFISDCKCLTIIVIFFFNGLHLLATAASGVLGLGKRQWLFPLHLFLGSCLLLTMTITHHYGVKYEPVIMEQTEMALWCSISQTRERYNSPGWDYIQYNLQCCGVNSYTDWCLYKHSIESSRVNTRSYSPCRYHQTAALPETDNENRLLPFLKLNGLTHLKGNMTVKLVSETNSDYKNTSEENKIVLSNVIWKEDIHENHYVLVNCYIPNSCCVVNLPFKDMAIIESALKPCDAGKPEETLYNRGCYLPILQVMKRFINSCMSIIICVVILLIVDLPVATYLMLHH